VLSHKISKVWLNFGQIFASDTAKGGAPLGALYFNALAVGDSCEYPDELYLASLATRVIVLPDTEDRTIVSSFLWTKHRNVTDRQANG